MRNQSLYTGNDIINIFRDAGVIHMGFHNDWNKKAIENARLQARTEQESKVRAEFNMPPQMTEEEKRRRKACPGKPLTKHPSRYLTEVDGTNCNKDAPAKHGPFKWQQKGVDTDKFRKQCEDIDKEES